MSAGLSLCATMVFCWEGHPVLHTTGKRYERWLYLIHKGTRVASRKLHKYYLRLFSIWKARHMSGSPNIPIRNPDRVHIVYAPILRSPTRAHLFLTVFVWYFNILLIVYLNIWALSTSRLATYTRTHVRTHKHTHTHVAGWNSVIQIFALPTLRKVHPNLHRLYTGSSQSKESVFWMPFTLCHPSVLASSLPRWLPPNKF